MTDFSSSTYDGRVVHTRLKPARHSFTYKVFALLLDVDEIDKLHRSLRLFSRNRFNLLGFYDGDHGASDGTPVGDHVRHILTEAGLGQAGARITLLCYPRILGFVFNPLSVYFCYNADGQLAVMVYEVSNTFGERKSYVIAVGDVDGGMILQGCGKELYVSPFTNRLGRYEFHIVPPGERVRIGVDFCEDDGVTLKTSFSGSRGPLTSRSLAGLVARHPLMVVKVVAGIHIEAARLWLKGVPVVARHSSPRFSYSVAPVVKREL